VATSARFRRSATAITEASVVPSGRLAYVFHQLGHPREVTGCQFDRREVTFRKRTQE
jgi:hypothetical protein